MFMRQFDVLLKSQKRIKDENEEIYISFACAIEHKFACFMSTEASQHRVSHVWSV